MLKHATFVASLALSALIATAALAEGETADTVVATVNGTDITLGQMIVTRARLPQQYQSMDPQVLFDGILDQMVQQQLMADTVPEEPKRVTLSLEVERRALLAGEAINDMMTTPVDETALQAAYAAAVADFPGGTEYNASHLLVATEDEALAAMARVNAGEDFAAVAKEVSSDGSAANGGNLGWFSDGMMVPEFETAVKELEPGQVSTPVKSQFGWHIIKLNETRAKVPPTIDEMREQLTSEIQNKALVDRLDELTAAGDITRPEAGAFDPALLTNLDLLNK